MSDRLPHKQTAAMLTLLALGREVANPDLKALVGFAIDGDVRRDLNERGFVTSEKRGRSFAHRLTEAGLAWCADELKADGAPPPPPRNTLARALYVLLGGLDLYLQRANLSVADVFASSADESSDDIEKRIRDAYRKLARAPRDWVGLVDLRPMLQDVPAKEIDAVLRALSRSRQAHLVPEDNRKALTAADHDAAIRIGGEDNHLLSIEAS